ncbi:DUF262 domain-containing protein [Moraxella osloensis]|nr:DUF262 domain-containing protein [Moraxella osloensis]MBW4018024.1 DUF262 domain-containing protein [Moraxella osloensis]
MENKVYYGEYSLKHWIDLILSKNIELPEYQRYFVWEEKKVETLIKAFEEKHFIPPVTIGSFQEDNKNSNLVLDGQQRLTSILLSYLGIYPNRDSFKKNSQNKIYNNSMDEPQDDEMDSDNMLEWNFTKLQEKGTTKQEILQNKGKNYKTINEIDIDFLENNYLGFCFLVPAIQDQKSQQKYYSSVFRAINIQGETLLPQESRASLYYLDKDLKPFFDPDFMKNFKITINNNKVSADFVRYISLISQYFHIKDVAKVAKGSKMQMEKYYEEYIYSVVSNISSSKFGKFLDLFPNNILFTRLEKLKEQISIIYKDKKEFKSIISLDLALFGLVYYVLFEGRLIDVSKRLEILKELSEKYQEFRKDDSHAKSPNNLGYLRARIKTSIEIYGKYLDESA